MSLRDKYNNKSESKVQWIGYLFFVLSAFLFVVAVVNHSSPVYMLLAAGIGTIIVCFNRAMYRG